MKVFVWKWLPVVSDNWHSDGGLVVFAETLERAKELAAMNGVRWEPKQDEPVEEWNRLDPDEIRSVEGGVEAVYIMPDAGCC